jgi:hypothetical protein
MAVFFYYVFSCKDSKGDIVASVEVLRDITDEIALQERVLEQNKSLKDDRDAAKSLQCIYCLRACRKRKE